MPRMVVKLPDGSSAKVLQTMCRESCLSFYPLFFSLGKSKIAALTAKAYRNYVPPDFGSFYAVYNSHKELLPCWLETLTEKQAVEYAYLEEVPLMPPAVFTHTGERYGPGYLKAAPEGVDALWAHTLKGGRGQDIRFIDIEQGWQLNEFSVKHHNDAGYNLEGCNPHGTQVLATLLLPENERGGTGIVPAACGSVISQWRPNGTFNTADAILTAISHLRYGDVLLLEAQVSDAPGSDRFWPVEIQPPVFEAIRLATALGITVVEAAGNGNQLATSGNNLDNYTWQGKKICNRFHPDFSDSGAVMVAAATCSSPHQPIQYSNYGSRIDCYSWGECVNAWHTYAKGLNGTSAAAAIIAGVVISLQGIAASHGQLLNPWVFRELLRNEAYGTPSAAGTGKDKIGVQPNMRKLVGEVRNYTLKKTSRSWN